MDLAYSDTWAPYNPFHGGSGMCIYKSLGVCAYSLDMCGFLCVAMSDLACRRTHTHHCPSVSHCWESSAMCTHVCTCICICCLILSHDREFHRYTVLLSNKVNCAFCGKFIWHVHKRMRMCVYMRVSLMIHMCICIYLYACVCVSLSFAQVD